MDFMDQKLKTRLANVYSPFCFLGMTRPLEKFTFLDLRIDFLIAGGTKILKCNLMRRSLKPKLFHCLVADKKLPNFFILINLIL